MRKRMKFLPATVLAAMLGLPGLFPASAGPAHAQSSIPQAVALDCANDINQFCRSITPGANRIVACLYAHNDKISGQCAYSVYAASGALASNMTALRHLARKTSCRSDLAAYCRGIPAGGGRLYNCLLRNKATLTDSCRGSLPEARSLLIRSGILR